MSDIPRLQAGTKNFRRNDFNLASGESMSFNETAGFSRHDVITHGTVGIIIDSDSQIVTDDLVNVFYSGSFTITAGVGGAIGFVTASSGGGNSSIGTGGRAFSDGFGNAYS